MDKRGRVRAFQSSWWELNSEAEETALKRDWNNPSRPGSFPLIKGLEYAEEWELIRLWCIILCVCCFKRRHWNQSSCTSLSFHSLIKWNWVTSWITRCLFPHWGRLRSLHWQSGPLAAACHSQPLSGNWVFIRLPVRERCSVVIWHNYQEKWSLLPLSGSRLVNQVEVPGTSVVLRCCRAQKRQMFL